MAKTSKKKVVRSGKKAPAARKRSTRSSSIKPLSARKTGGPRGSISKASGKSPSLKVPIMGGIGDEAVRKATGKGWAEWIAMLDSASADAMSHSEIADHLSEKCGVPPWWGQMVTVGYEQAKGRRVKHEKPEGFEVSVSKTLGVPVEQAFEAWQDAGVRKKWLADHGFDIRKATPHKSMRIDWLDGRTRLSVNFYARPNGKSQVVAQHMKLKTSAEAEKMKAYWAKQLRRLNEVLGE